MIAADRWIAESGAESANAPSPARGPRLDPIGDVRMIMQVHDELVFEVRTAALAETTARIAPLHGGGRNLSVPLVVDIGVGDSWGMRIKRRPPRAGPRSHRVPHKTCENVLRINHNGNPGEMLWSILGVDGWTNRLSPLLLPERGVPDQVRDMFGPGCLLLFPGLFIGCIPCAYGEPLTKSDVPSWRRSTNAFQTLKVLETKRKRKSLAPFFACLNKPWTDLFRPFRLRSN